MSKGFKGLFDIKKVATREQYENLVAKSQKLQKTKSTTQKGGSLIVKIKNICDQVQQRLGHYAQELQLIQTEEDLVRYIDKCIENGKIAIDTETTGLDAFTDKIVGVCIYTYNQKAAYIPINHISYITNFRIAEQLTEQQVAQQLQRLVEAKTEIIMFNAKFDVRVIRQQLNVYLTPNWCGFIAAKCLKNNETEGNLKYLWKKYCSPDKEAEHFTFDKMFDGIRFDMIPLNTAYLYAAKDALMTMELYDFQKPYLTETDPKCIDLGFQKLAKLYNEIELPIIPIVADIEDTGVALDVEYCKQLSEKYNIKLQEAEEKFHKELENYKDQLTSYINTHPQTKLEDPINIASPTQLAELFYDVLKQPSVSKKSPRGTGEEILEKMGHPLGKLILDYRGVAKLLNTYIDKMPAIVNKKTGRIHCSFNQYGTDTGRFSCIAKGTKISVPYGDKNIEDVQAGDLVYSYTEEGKLQLNKVKKAWHTGSKKCIKLHWTASYNNALNGVLICTPDHYIKTYNGWKQAQHLTPEDQIYFVSRRERSDGYMSLTASFKQGHRREHNWIKEKYFNINDKKLVVHHKDYCRANNNPNNLEIVTAKEHINIHRQMRNGYCNALDLTKEELIKLCEDVNWDIRKIDHDYESLKSWLKYHKINYIKNYSDAYDIRPTTLRASGKSFKYKSLPLIEDNLKYALELANNNIEEAASYFGQNSHKFKNYCRKFGLLDNHNVTKIELLEECYDVYDLEVENAHCFIANELCVHNSSNPNLQNIPSHNKDIRPMFVGTTHKDIICEDKQFNLLYCDIVPTLHGKKYSQDLQIGDTLMCDDGNHTITNIITEQPYIKVYI